VKVDLSPCLTPFPAGLTRQQQLTGAMKTSTRMASGMFDEWAASSEIPLFESCSRLLLRSILMAYFGDRFANDHEAELSVMIEGYHHALVNPWARVLPLWASPAGRMLSRMKGTMEALIKAEVDERMAFRDEWRDADDYLSYLLTANERSGFQESTSEYAAHFVSGCKGCREDNAKCYS
jgi:cytochrome P450